MSHLIVGDGHFTASSSLAAWQRLVEAAREQAVREVSILGDFMELWLGLEGLERAWQDALFAPLWRLRQEGARLRYVVGNKDYFIADWNQRHGLFHDVVAHRCRVPSPAGVLWLEHGDLVNHRDRQYRLWRGLSRSWPAGALVRALPRAFVARRAWAVAEAMRGTNQYHKSYFPAEALRARARELPAGPATVIYGHFHVHRELQEGDKRVITLPFLGGEGAGLWVSEAGIQRLDAPL